MCRIQSSYLRRHIRFVHENSDAKICDICAKYFKGTKAYELHYLVEHTNTLEKVQCELCGKWLKHEEMLKEHMRRHRDSKETCSICGMVSLNKKALRAHIQRIHANLTFPCTVCNKVLKRAYSLKVILTHI